MRKNIKFKWWWLFIIIPIVILLIYWLITSYYEIWQYKNFTVTFYPNKDNPKIVKAYRLDKNGNTVEDYIFVKWFNCWWEYNFIDKVGFFVDEIEFNGGNMTKANSFREEVKSASISSASVIDEK